MDEETSFVSSGADLAASDAEDSPDAPGAVEETASEPISPDAEGGIDLDALNDRGEETAEEPVTPDNQVHETEEEKPEPEPEPVAAADAEQLPDGVRKGKDRNGKEGLFVTPERWEVIYNGSHKTMKALEEIAGEPVTPQVFDVYSRAFLGQEKLYSDLLSGDPKAQGSVLSHFLKESAEAMERGEIAQDPIVSLAQTFYGTMKDSHPDAYAKLRMDAATDLVEELYQEAAAKGNKSLWDSAGHVALALGMSYKKSAEMEPFRAQATDPSTALQKKVQELEAKLNGRQTTNQAAQFDAWQADQSQKVSTSLMTDAILPALADSQKAWEKLPGGKDAFRDLVVDRLHSKVRETLRSDDRFKEKIDQLDKNARRAASAQRRSEIGDQIRQAYLNRAKLAVEAHRPEIEKFANRVFKEQNDATHQRRQAAARHATPAGGGTPVKRSLVPTKADEFEYATPANLRASLDGILG